MPIKGAPGTFAANNLGWPATAPQGAETPKICRLPDSTSSERSQCEALHKTTPLPELRTMNKSATAHGSANSSQSPMTPSHVAVTQSTAMLSHNLNLPASDLDTSLLNPTVKLPSNCRTSQSPRWHERSDGNPQVAVLNKKVVGSNLKNGLQVLWTSKC